MVVKKTKRQNEDNRSGRWVVAETKRYAKNTGKRRKIVTGRRKKGACDLREKSTARINNNYERSAWRKQTRRDRRLVYFVSRTVLLKELYLFSGSKKKSD